MALTFSLLTNGQSTTDGLSFTTASVSVPAGALCVVLINGQSFNTSDRQPPTGVAGTGYTLDQITNQQDASFLTTSVWRARQTGAFTGSITISYSLNQDNVQWAVYSVTGNIDTAGTNGSEAIGNTAVNLGTGTTLSQTLSFGGSNNGAIAAFGWDSTTSGAGATATPASGWTEGSDQGSLEAGYSAALQTQWRTDNGQPSVTWSATPASGSVTLVAVEIKDTTSPASSDVLEQADDGVLAYFDVLQAHYRAAIGVMGAGIPVGNRADFFEPPIYSPGLTGEIAAYQANQDAWYNAVLNTLPWFALEEPAGAVDGSSATVNANDTPAATGFVVDRGSSTTTNANDTSAATGFVVDQGASATTNANDSVAAVGVVVDRGSSATVNANDTSNASGSVGGNVVGIGTAVNSNDTASAAGVVTGDAMSGGDGGGSSRSSPGNAIKQKLLIAYEDEQARKAAAKALKKISDAERAALKKLARKIEAQPVDSYESIAQQVEDSLASIGYEPKELHIDWLMYYMRILAYQIAQEALSEEEEILMVMMA